VTKRGLTLVVLACVPALAAPALGARPVPASVSAYLVGPKLIRGEVVVKGNTLLDYRLDRGKLLKRSNGRTLNLLERDGTKTVVTVAPGARVFLNGALSTVRRLRAGVQIAVAHEGDLPAAAVFASTKQSPRWPKSVVAQMFGKRLVRAEIALRDTILHDYRLDHGRIKQVGVFTLLLGESDGTDVTIDISPGARVKVNGKSASFAQLRKGMMATTMRDGDKPADQVFATGR
jgi:hypothetical protein